MGKHTKSYPKTCEWCNEPFLGLKQQRFCSMSCASQYKNDAESMKRLSVERGKDRPFTAFTEYYIKLWRSKGDSCEKIAEVLNRPVSVIYQVLGEVEPPPKPKFNNDYFIRCVETGEMFNTITEAAKVKGLQSGNISRCIHGSMKRTGGYHWEMVQKGDDA